MHGWLVKWRSTFSGNERLRKEGIREMREAKAVRERQRQRRAARRAKAGASKSCFRLWPISFGKKERQSKAKKALTRSSHRPSSKRRSPESTRRPTSPNHSPRLTPSSSRRPSQIRKGSVDYNARSSRKASHDSRRDNVRSVEKKR